MSGRMPWSIPSERKSEPDPPAPGAELPGRPRGFEGARSRPPLDNPLSIEGAPYGDDRRPWATAEVTKRDNNAATSHKRTTRRNLQESIPDPPKQLQHVLKFAERPPIPFTRTG